MPPFTLSPEGLRAVLLTPSPRSLHPTKRSYLHTGMKPQLKSCVCHSYENCRGVGVFFPEWNSRSATQPSFTSILPYTLPSSVCFKSFIYHSYENCRGGGLFFPEWNSTPSDRCSYLPLFSASGAAACGGSFRCSERTTCKPSNVQTLSIYLLYSHALANAHFTTPLFSNHYKLPGGCTPPLLQFPFSLFHFPVAPPVVPYCVRKRSRLRGRSVG
jgi:hypothetical protein